MLSQHALQVVSQHALQGGLLQGGAWFQGVPAPGGVCSWGRGVVPALGGVPDGNPPWTATAVGGTHPTVMHSCYVCLFTGRGSSLSPCDKSHGNPQPWLPGPVQTCSRRDPSPCPPTAFWPPCCLL